jgi:hypothetical protein
MKAPGFTAEASVYRSAGYYSAGSTSGDCAGLVEPQSFKSVFQGIGVGASLGAAFGTIEGGVGGAIGAVIGGVIGGLFCAIFECA